MDCKEVLVKLREKNGLSQQELADRLFVTRQAVSRWERGKTLPSSDLFRQLSTLFHVSINTLLGSPSHLICQSCGMPLEDDIGARRGRRHQPGLLQMALRWRRIPSGLHHGGDD